LVKDKGLEHTQTHVETKMITLQDHQHKTMRVNTASSTAARLFLTNLK